jgi:hypothetical protein
MGSMTPDEMLRDLHDRSAIMDCLHRYTRGADRLDEELLRSAFHPDAVDYHGVVNGSVDEFLAYWLPLQAGREASQHYIANTTIDVDGDTAHVEAYYTHYQKLKSEPQMTVSGGRYADRFERREGRWRIALRVVIPGWQMVADGTPTTARVARNPRGRTDRTDPVYMRPLAGPPDEWRVPS